MASLTGQYVSETYDSLLKVVDNNVLTGTLKDITDGFGNVSALQLSTTAAKINGTLEITGTATASNLSGTNTGDETNASIKTKLGAASAIQDGYLTAANWTTFNAKQNALTIGNLTEATSSVLTITGGTGAIIGSGLTIQVKQASNLQSGFLTSSDWLTFSAKQNALTNPITGTGTANYLAKFTGTTSQSNSQIFDNGTNVGIGTASPISIGGHSGVLTLYGSNATALVLQDVVSRKDIRLNDGNLSFTNSSGTSHFYIADGGNIGIGTTTLDSLLNLQTTAADARITINANNSVNTPYMTFRSVGVNKATIGLGQYNGGSLNNLLLYCDSGDTIFANSTEQMRLTSTGRLGIGTTSPVATAKVQIDSTTQGFLPPRMTSAQRTAIASPATGLIVYQTDGTEGLYVKRAAAWALITAI